MADDGSGARERERERAREREREEFKRETERDLLVLLKVLGFSETCKIQSRTGQWRP
jgi:hypothetical protein